ncbi:MAG: hypothetical protein PHG74_02295, partial [Kiritimatiellae bacterium]|nr:hypothetical protein [Kiritimatiellia bacterium]
CAADRYKALSVFSRAAIFPLLPRLPRHGNTLPHRENASQPLIGPCQNTAWGLGDLDALTVPKKFCVCVCVREN